MSEVPLARQYSPETYAQALTNVVKRWEENKGEEPVKYDEAAIGMDKSTVSTPLKYFAEINLLESPKAGYYKVPDEVVDYKNKVGEIQREAKQKVRERISNYPVYSEATFYLGVNDFDLQELIEEVAGSSEVAASKEELDRVKRSILVLGELGFLQIDDDGGVSVPSDLDMSPNSAESSSQDSEDEVEKEGDVDQPETSNTGADNTEDIQQQVNNQSYSESVSQSGLAVDVEISMDVTEMEKEEVRNKLEVIDEIFNKDEE